MSSRARSATWPAVAFVVVLVLLLGWNAHAWRRNHKQFGQNDIPRLVPRNIARVAERNPMNVVRYVFAFYYRMRLLDGATLVAPPAMQGHRFNLEHFAQLDVEIDPSLGEMDAALVDRLTRQTSDVRYLHIETATMGVRIFFEPGTRRYVMARIAGSEGFVILPAARYAAEQPSR